VIALIKSSLVPVDVSICGSLSAQYNVHIKLLPLAEKISAEEIYVAGSFNGWNPKDETFRLKSMKKGF
jgi:hypothetical protein